MCEWLVWAHLTVASDGRDQEWQQHRGPRLVLSNLWRNDVDARPQRTAHTCVYEEENIL